MDVEYIALRCPEHAKDYWTKELIKAWREEMRVILESTRASEPGDQAVPGL